jgi:preprotein translocase subunit SecF
MTIGVEDDLDIPGVTRRHRFSDLYHERTNFQFIAHRRRWLVLSAVLMIVSVAALFIRDLNLGIEFEGGTSWQVPVADDKSPSVPEVRDVLDPLGLADAKVSILSGQGERSVRVQAQVLNDPVEEFRDALATYADVGNEDVVLERNAEGGGTYTVIAKKEPRQ